MALRLSQNNWLRTSTASAVGVITGFPASNARVAERPFTTTRLTSGAQQDLIFDIGSAQPIGFVGLINVNFTSVSFFLSNVSNFSTIVWSSGVLAVAANPATRRRQRFVYIASAVTGRYFMVRVPSQATDPGTPSAYCIGGVWAGPVYPFTGLDAASATRTPRTWDWNYAYGPIRPELNIGPDHEGWSRTVRRGDPRIVLTGSLRVFITQASPGYNDGLSAWWALQNLLWANGNFAVADDFAGTHDAAQTWIAEEKSAEATIDYPTATIPLRWPECI
jgi:hypothetical protein